MNREALPDLLDLMDPVVTVDESRLGPEMVTQTLLSQCDRRASRDDALTQFGESWPQSPELDLVPVLDLKLFPLKIQKLFRF